MSLKGLPVQACALTTRLHTFVLLCVRVCLWCVVLPCHPPGCCSKWSTRGEECTPANRGASFSPLWSATQRVLRCLQQSSGSSGSKQGRTRTRAFRDFRVQPFAACPPRRRHYRPLTAVAHRSFPHAPAARAVPPWLHLRPSRLSFARGVACLLTSWPSCSPQTSLSSTAS